MPRIPKAPKPGSRQIPASFLSALEKETSRAGKLVGGGSMSSGAGGTVFPDLSADAVGVKLVYIPQIFGAFGGPSGNYANANDNALLKEYKNFVGDSEDEPTRTTRKVYPIDADVYEITAEGAKATGETIKVVNVSGFARWYSWALVAPVSDELWAITSVLDNGDFALGCKWAPDVTADESLVGDADQKIIRGTVSSVIESVTPFNNQLKKGWAHVDTTLQDFFIHSPGVFEITYGAEIACTIEGSRTYPVISVTTDSGGSPSHTHSFKLPTGGQVELRLFADFNGQASALVYTDGDSGSLGSGAIVADYVQGTTPPPILGDTSKRAVSLQKTCHLVRSLDKNNGQPYTRLSLALKTETAAKNDNTKAASFRILRAWLFARPLAFSYMATGYDAFLGEKSESNTDGWQWWGGGPKPKKVLRDGTNEDY